MENERPDFLNRLHDAVINFDYDSALTLNERICKYASKDGGGILTPTEDKLWDMLLAKLEQHLETIRTVKATNISNPYIPNGTDAEDAERWRALVNCARISSMGSAGLGDNPHENNYAHLTLNLWTVYPDVESDSGTLQWLKKFSDIAVKEYRRKQGL